MQQAHPKTHIETVVGKVVRWPLVIVGALLGGVQARGGKTGETIWIVVAACGAVAGAARIIQAVRDP